MLEISFGEVVPLEMGHGGNVWGKTGRLVLSCREGRMWCCLVEGAKRRLRSL